MSRMASAGNPCQITSNPDVSGIGVRTAIYTQALLSFIPAVIALLDKEVVLTELKSLETQSMTLLIAAFAILISTIIQGHSSTMPLSNFHATIILDLSWMNNTNTFIYFLLWLFHEIDKFRHTQGGSMPLSALRHVNGWVDLMRHLTLSNEQVHPETVTVADSQRQGCAGIPHWVISRSLGMRRRDHLPVMFLGSMHLSMMSGVGLWLWSNPGRFGNSGLCTDASIFVVGNGIPFGSRGLRVWSIFMYTLLLPPVLNLIPPILFFVCIHYLAHRVIPKSAQRDWGLLSPTCISLAILAIIDIILLADIEVALKINSDNGMLEPGDSQWTYGQTLALLLLLLPIRDILEVIRQQPSRTLGRELFERLEGKEKRAALGALKSGADVRIRGKIVFSHGRTALIFAAEKGNLDIINALVKRRPDFWAKDNSGETALHAAAKNGFQEIIKILLSYETRNIQEKNGNGCTPLDLAIKNGHLEAVEALVERGDADPTLCGGEENAGRSREDILRFAIENGHPEVVKALIKGHSGVRIEGELGYRILCLAARFYGNEEKSSKHKDVFDFLVGEYHKTRESSTALHVALQKGDFEIGNALARHERFKPKIDTYDEHGNTPLGIAAKKSRLEIVKSLLASHADIAKQNQNGQTALHLAATHNSTPEIAKALLELDKAGLTATALDEDLQTALHRAAANTHGAGLIQVLLTNKALLMLRSRNDSFLITWKIDLALTLPRR
ncbi:hypothetical protein NP233_g8664 [Leucocoprinus birnbaumii]|uniref:Uncharacterized protein n=1 Tax=Leucocoprinus birnbaumii TaxID=56174 RepID=A0AAD5VM06_9AGAR|nr:hypothetical protein NP233_g8664 [Leucocoprinus birnbaumii]